MDAIALKHQIAELTKELKVVEDRSAAKDFEILKLQQGVERYLRLLPKLLGLVSPTGSGARVHA